MTINLLNQLIKDNNISKDVKLLSDSGWECSETEIGGVWYSESYNTIIFTQNYIVEYTYKNDKCKCLYRDIYDE